MNTRYFEIESRVLAAIPDAGAKDDGYTAAANMEFQQRYFREHGPGIVVIFTDTMVAQNKDARRVYTERAVSPLHLGIAIVGETMLSRAVATLYLGDLRPKVPHRMFATFNEADAWLRPLLEASS